MPARASVRGGSLIGGLRRPYHGACRPHRDGQAGPVVMAPICSHAAESGFFHAPIGPLSPLWEIKRKS